MPSAFGDIFAPVYSDLGQNILRGSRETNIVGGQPRASIDPQLLELLTKLSKKSQNRDEREQLASSLFESMISQHFDQPAPQGTMLQNPLDEEASAGMYLNWGR